MNRLTCRLAKIEEALEDRLLIEIAPLGADREALRAEIARARRIDPRRVVVLPADTVQL